VTSNYPEYRIFYILPNFPSRFSIYVYFMLKSQPCTDWDDFFWILSVCFTRLGILNWCAISCLQFPGIFLKIRLKFCADNYFESWPNFHPEDWSNTQTMPSFIRFGSALQSLFPYYGHVICSMEITAQVLDRTLWNLAWLYTLNQSSGWKFGYNSK